MSSAPVPAYFRLSKIPITFNHKLPHLMNLPMGSSCAKNREAIFGPIIQTAAPVSNCEAVNIYPFCKFRLKTLKKSGVTPVKAAIPLTPSLMMAVSYIISGLILLTVGMMDLILSASFKVNPGEYLFVFSLPSPFSLSLPELVFTDGIITILLTPTNFMSTITNGHHSYNCSYTKNNPQGR